MAIKESLLNIDSGTKARFLKIGMIAIVVVGLCLVYSMIHFKGLGTEAAMDQAQIARSLANREGFSTRYIRPLAIRQLVDSAKIVPSGNFPDFVNAPLFPLLEAVVLYPVKNRLMMKASDVLSPGDRVLAFLGIALLLAGVFVWYRVGCRLFDQSLALLAAGLMTATDLLWQYALAGLPQLFLIILFGLATLSAIHAKTCEDEGGKGAVLWLAVAGFMFGLMSLTHGVTAFLFPGFLLFTLVGFRSKAPSFFVPLGVYLLCVSPWLLRNYFVCGNPLGLTIYYALSGAGVSESSLMRGAHTGLSIGGGLASKFRGNLMDQANHLWEYLGLNIAAVGMAFSLLHPFRERFTALWRWFVLLMWIGASIGMAFFGVQGVVSGNQLHLLFLPVFLLYGTAFLLVLWNRLHFTFKPVRIAFLTLVFLVSGAPMLITLLEGSKARIQWPPYVPPFISVMQNWFGTDEVLCSDMPWAVAWYANRKCLLLPETVRAFTQISDYRTLGSPIVALYLTPVSGNQNFLELIKGPNKDWSQLIMRTVNLNDFILKSFTPLPIDGECILYADRERWVRK